MPRRRRTKVTAQAVLQGTTGTLPRHAPDSIALDRLSTLGPIFVLKLKAVGSKLGRKVVTELWLFPDGSRILELSTKCLPSEAFDTAARSRATLSEHGIPLTGGQETKTKRALEQFSAAL